MRFDETARPLVSLTTLRSGPADHAVVVDFIKFSGQPSAGDLVTTALADRSVLRADPVADLSDSRGWLPLGELAGEYARLIAALDPTPSVLVGYCSGAPLALLIAGELAHEGTRVPVLLLAPRFPDRRQVLDDLAGIRRSIGAAGRPPGRPPADLVLPQDPVAAVRYIGSVLSDDLAAAAEDDTAGTALTDDLVARYTAWLGYLLAAADAPLGDVPADVCIVASPDPWSTPNRQWPTTARIHPTTLTGAEFLTSPETAAVIASHFGTLR
ncbi:hypothetical protein AB0D45_15695 [Streptomyces sp. NPDC048352]|uniref:hypothetical protein n=1 Tax=Streptomyces sp. NPDC048352 TaxID=3154718 RepID=UPI003438A901